MMYWVCITLLDDLSVLVYYTEIMETKVKTIRERQRALRDEILQEMKVLRDQGMTMAEIGKLFGVKRAAVNNFLKGNNLGATR